MKYNARAEKCATCTFWGGDRDVINFGNYIEVNPNDQGACNAEGSTSRHLDSKSAQWGCNQWEKWGALKG